MFEAGDMLIGYIDRQRGRGHVPTLCDAPHLKPFGACRVCSVEIYKSAVGLRRVVESCHTPVTPGMHVFTESPKVLRLRRNLIELVLTDHPLDCLMCEANGNCELQTVATKGDEVLSITAAEDSLVNSGHACLKGRYAFNFHKHPDRLRSPMLRKNGELEVVSWDEAYACIVKNLSRIREVNGARAIGGIASARCTNEENYLIQKFIRAVIGCENIDSCARLCHSPTAFGMQQSFGTGAATNGFEDIDSTDCFLIIGANPTEAHPVVGARIKQRVMKGVPLIVIDPRRIELTAYAKYHLQARPGTNAAVFNLMARFILDAGMVDTDFIMRRCEGWAEVANGLRTIDIDRMAEITGVDCELIRAAAIEYASADGAMCFHGLGVTEYEQGAKCVMLTVTIGRPATGMNPLRGQNNVQGAADLDCQPRQGPGYLDLSNSEYRSQLEKIYGVELDGQAGLGLTEMMNAAIDGRLKALWVIGDDLVQTAKERRFSMWIASSVVSENFTFFNGLSPKS